MNKDPKDVLNKNNRAYSVVSVKNFEDKDDFFIFSGIATTPKTDRHGDVVEPKGIEFENPVPLLWQHRHAEPVGHVYFEEATDEGVKFTAKIPYIKEDGELKKRVDEAIHSIKYGLVRCLSIGFRTLKYAWIDETYGMHIQEWECYELSLVTIPANSDAIITEIKRLDLQQRALPIKIDPTRKSVGASTKKKKVIKIY
ncbi:HK97 family phage prohead protease [Ignatzschineria indica]|uniref:HK97 family phage prohead protease n=1 Tax=Ignatzschineria indica TaxID=472583 RepID=UPI002574FB5F|nr:HK97 family phage prohead protease [Ignatzschineria indica]MDM1545525.1 HK97 family phage prohead protease [Ignatzschineria indica]